jgi:hypothetical protein
MPRAMPLQIIDELNGLKVKANFMGWRNVFGRTRQGTGRLFVQRTDHHREELRALFTISQASLTIAFRCAWLLKLSA